MHITFVHLCTATVVPVFFLVILPFFCGLLQIFKTSIQSEKSKFRQHGCIIIKYLLCESQVLRQDTVCMGMTFTTTVSVCQIENKKACSYRCTHAAQRVARCLLGRQVLACFRRK